MPHQGNSSRCASCEFVRRLLKDTSIEPLSSILECLVLEELILRERLDLATPILTPTYEPGSRQE